MEMAFSQYISNPTGMGTAVMSYRKMYEDLYHDKWNKIMTREMGKIEYNLYKDKKARYAHIKVPSETVENFYYDVVIRFDNSANKLDECNVQFFSNDPSFNYTFAYAFKKNKLTIPELESKMSKEALRTPAKEKNPQNIIGYVKVFYFAYIFMSEKGFFYPTRFDAEAKPYSKAILLSKVMGEEKLEERINAAKKKEDKKNKTAKPTKRDIIHPEVRNGGVSGRAGGVHTVKSSANIIGSNRKSSVKIIKSKRKR